MTIEYREATGGIDAGSGKITGLTAPFSSETTIRDVAGEFRESFEPGAFTDSLAKRGVVYLVCHDSAQPIARTDNGSLKLTQSQRGLEIEATPNNTSYAQDHLENIRSGVITGMSFGFRATNEAWLDDDGNETSPMSATRRVVRSADLFEVSGVTFPAYDGTELSARSSALERLEQRAPKATYADVETCGECGATSQYGSYCSNCGGSMSQSYSPGGKFCTDCGSELDTGNRDSHICAETRADATMDEIQEHHDLIAAIDASLDEAMSNLCKPDVDRDQLPAEVNQAIDLIKSASANVSKLMQDKGIPDPDKPNGSTYADADSDNPPAKGNRSIAETLVALRMKRL